MGEEIAIKVSDEEIAIEVAYGIIGRAQDIHDNPDNQFEHIALELRDVGQEMLNEYEG